jgi:integrase
MSDSIERNLRRFIALSDTPATLAGDLDALLAEHRAEVERLRTALKARRTKMDAAARDAALEEAEGEVDALADDARDSGRQDRAHVLDIASERIRALKSSPCAVLPVDKVREVLDELRNVKTCGQGAYADGVRHAAAEALRLLDLDDIGDGQ